MNCTESLPFFFKEDKNPVILFAFSAFLGKGLVEHFGNYFTVDYLGKVDNLSGLSAKSILLDPAYERGYEEFEDMYQVCKFINKEYIKCFTFEPTSIQDRINFFSTIPKGFLSAALEMLVNVQDRHVEKRVFMCLGLLKNPFLLQIPDAQDKVLSFLVAHSEKFQSVLETIQKKPN